MKIRKNDIVQVITGDDSKGKKPKQGKVLSVNLDSGRILVEGVNFVWRHLRRSQEHPHGARIQKEATLQASNVRIICQSCDKPTKVVYKKQGVNKTSICRKCRAEVTQVSPKA